ncbi:ATP-binding cassette domain-containing protein [Propionibacterium sp.]|uniref:ABC transporter ATP-binding protein n=1 Tax=Propionibacterium sp. TaxID=1977903 RepID=UPI0039EC5A4A
MSTALETTDLVKTFGHVRALDGLNLHLEKGEIHGFLGPNGAGKSTAIRILLGLMRSDSGSVRVLGADPWRDTGILRRKLGYVPGEVSLWPNLTGGEVIDLLVRLQGSPDAKRRTELLELFELDPSKKCRSYSKGNRQKVALVATLACPAELYVFDEPTSGLDPLMEAAFQRCVRELRSDGATVLLSSHILSEVEELSDKISIIRAGRIIRSATLDEMRSLHTTRITATLRAPTTLDGLTGISQLHQDGNRLTFSVDSAQLDAAVAVLSRTGVVSLVCEPPSLEELFLSSYDESGTGGPR